MIIIKAKNRKGKEESFTFDVRSAAKNYMKFLKVGGYTDIHTSTVNMTEGHTKDKNNPFNNSKNL